MYNMNLKKAFRYQNLFKKLLTEAISNIKSQDFMNRYALHKKSELNELALVKNYEDEIKNDFSLSGFDYTSKYDYEALDGIIKQLIFEKTLLTEAISKAKVKARIQPISFEAPITYDSAVALASTYRKYIDHNTMVLNSIEESKTERTVQTKIIVSTDQPPIDAYYTKETIIEVLNDKKEALDNNSKWAKNFVEDLSDKIEATAIQTEVKFTTDIPITSTLDSLYKTYLQKTSIPTCDDYK